MRIDSLEVRRGLREYQGDDRAGVPGANRQPAAAACVCGPGEPVYRPFAIAVLRIEDCHIVVATAFQDPGLFPAFGLEVDEAGRRLAVRNGHHESREVTTAAGAIPVRAPRVNDKRVDPVTGQRQRFSSAILPAWARKSPKVAEVRQRAQRSA